VAKKALKLLKDLSKEERSVTTTSNDGIADQACEAAVTVFVDAQEHVANSFEDHAAEKPSESIFAKKKQEQPEAEEVSCGQGRWPGLKQREPELESRGNRSQPKKCQHWGQECHLE